jgi:deoxyribonuclease V
MNAGELHSWDLTPKEAIALQRELRSCVLCEDCIGEVRAVAGIDVGFEDEGNTTRAAVAVLSFPELALIEHSIARVRTRFPYVPGLLSFREAPAVLEAFAKLRTTPDLILYDGHGLAHPRRFGIASHVGLLLDRPTIGVAKTLLVGQHRAPRNRRGAWAALEDAEEVIGAALRTRVDVKPLYVSVGHRVTLPTAIRWVIACATRYRLPETTRWAHRLASHKVSS